MDECQRLGVEHQPCVFTGSVQGVSDDGSTEPERMSDVESKLVGMPGARKE
ncbi:hypothetical protein ACN28S_20970 [Cystobacter fuscus]